MPSIKVDVGMDAKKFFTDASELKRAINSFQTTVKQAGKDMRDSMYGYGTAMQKSVAENKKAQQSMQALKDEAYRLSDAIDEFSNKKIETNQYKELKANIGKAKEEMARLKEQREQMQKSGNSNSEEYKLLATTIGATINKLTKLEDEYKNIMKLQNQMSEMLESGTDDKGQMLSEEQKNSLSAAIDDNQTKLIEYENQMKKLTQIRDKYVTEQNQMRVNGDWMSAPYRKLMEAITLTRRHMRSLIEDKHKMEAQGHNSQFIYGAETEEFEKMEKQEQELIDKFQEMYKVKNKALMPPYLQSWKKMVTFTGLINEGFGRIRNAASGAIYAIVHPFQAANRALGFLLQKTGQVAASLARMAGNAALKFLRNLASTAQNEAIKLAQLAGNAVLAGLQRIAVGAKNAAINLAKIAGSAVLGALSKLANAARRTAAAVARIGGSAVKTAINGLVSLAARGTKAILGIGKSSRAANGGLKMSLKTILKYAFGVRSMFFLFRRLRTAVTDGLGAIAKKNPELQKSLNGLTRAFNALKGSLSTAFAPIVTAVAPALTMLINMLTSAINTIGAFLAALTGKTSYQKSIGAIGSSAKSSSKSVKDLNRQLASFDELNILSDKNNSGGGGGSSDGGGFAYETAAIESGIIDFVDELKKLWEKADFEGIGRIIADGINKAITKARDAISWKTLGDKITSVVNGITGVINGLIDGVDWGNIGETFGEGINTLVNTWNKLFDGIKFVNLGKGLADVLNGLVDTVDWDGLGKAFTKRINAIFDTLFGLVTNFKWGEAGKKFATAVSSFANNINWTVIGCTLSEGIKGALEFLTNAIITFDWDSLTKNLQNGIRAIDWDGIGEKFSDFANSIFDINWYQIGNTLRMAIDGVLDMLISAVKNFRWGDAGSAFAKAVRGLYSKDTFDRLSTLLGDGINGAMEALTKAVSGFEWGKIGTDFGNAVNKLKDKVDWFKIGSTLNKLLGVALSMMVNAIKTIEWGDAGEKFAKALNAFFSKDAKYNVWALATETISEMALGLVDFTDKFIVTANWEQIGTDIQNGFRKVPWREIGTAVWGMMEDAFRATGSFLSALTGEKKTVDVNLSYGAWKTEQLKKQAGNVAKSTQSIWNDVADNLTNGFNNAINALTSFIENLPVSNTVTALADWLVRVREGIKWDNLGILFGSGIKKALEGIGGILAKWADGAKAIGENIGTFLNNAIKKVDWFSDSDGSVKMIIQNFFKGAVGMVRGFFDNLDVEALGTNLRLALLGVDWKGIAQDIWDALSSALSKIGNFITVLFGGESPNFDISTNDALAEKLAIKNNKKSGIGSSVGGAFSNIAQSILESIKWAISNIPWKDIGDEVHDFLVAIEWKDIASKLWDAIIEAAKGLGTAIIHALFGSDRTNAYGQSLQNTKDAIQQKGFIGAVQDGIEKANKADVKITDLLGKIVNPEYSDGTTAFGNLLTSINKNNKDAWWWPLLHSNDIDLSNVSIGTSASAEESGDAMKYAQSSFADTVRRAAELFFKGSEDTSDTLSKTGEKLGGAASKLTKKINDSDANNYIYDSTRDPFSKDYSGPTSNDVTWENWFDGNVEVNIDAVPDGDKSGNTSKKKLSKAMDGTPVDTSVTYDGSKPGRGIFTPKKNLEKGMDGSKTTVNVDAQPNVSGGASYKNNGLLNWLNAVFAPGVDTQSRVALVREKWETIYNWIQNYMGGAVTKGVGVERSKFQTIASWIIGSFMGGNVNKGVGISSLFGTVAKWLRAPEISGGSVSKGVGVINSGFKNVANWLTKTPGLMGGNVLKGIGVTNIFKSVASWLTKTPGLMGGDVLKGIGVINSGFKSVASWLTKTPGLMGGDVLKGIGVINSGFKNVANWLIKNLMGGDVTKGVGVTNSKFKDIADWLSRTLMGGDVVKDILLGSGYWGNIGYWLINWMMGGTVLKDINLGNGGWNDIGYWLITWMMGGDVVKPINLTNEHSNWTKGLVDWITDGAGFIKLTVNLVAGVIKGFQAIFGGNGATGGIINDGGNVIIPFAKGGSIMRHGKSSWWDSATKYASGTSRAHGTVFVAGEAGPEIMGHVNGRTEILNKSQLAQAIYSAVVSGMGAAVNALGKYLANHMSTCANAIVSTISANSGFAALNGLRYYTPAIASGGIVPYAVSEQIAKSTEAIQSTLNANNEDLIQTIISVAGQLVSAVSGLQNRQSPVNTINAQQVINEINRQYMMGLNPIKGV